MNSLDLIIKTGKPLTTFSSLTKLENYKENDVLVCVKITIDLKLKSKEDSKLLKKLSF